MSEPSGDSGEGVNDAALLTYRSVVYPWLCDTMGHMNTQFYSAAFDAAAFALLNEIEPLENLASQGLGWADVRQLIEYKREMPAGAQIIVHSRVVRVGKSSITSTHTMSDGVGDVTCTCETVTAHFDLEKRQSRPFTDAMRKRANALTSA